MTVIHLDQVLTFNPVCFYMIWKCSFVTLFFALYKPHLSANTWPADKAVAINQKPLKTTTSNHKSFPLKKNLLNWWNDFGLSPFTERLFSENEPRMQNYFNNTSQTSILNVRTLISQLQASPDCSRHFEWYMHPPVTLSIKPQCDLKG